MDGAGMEQTKNEGKASSFKTLKIANELFLFIFLLNVVFLPNDTFNVKIVSLAILLVINVPFFLTVKTKDELAVFLFGFVLTSFDILLSVLLTGQVYENVRMGYPGYILMLYPSIKHYKTDFSRMFMFVLSLMAYFVVLCALADFCGLLDITENPALMWLHDSSNAMVGKGDYLPLRFMIFMKTSPLLFVLLLYSLLKKRYISAAVAAGAILASGTRANVFMLLGALVVYFCFLHKNRTVRIVSMICAAIAVVLLIIDFRAVRFVIDVFTRKSGSDEVRSGHLKGLFELWGKSPWKLIFGSGFSSTFFSYGVMENVSTIELSYWNLLRQVGIVPFICLMAMYLYPIAVLIKKNRGVTLTFAYSIYLVIAYTNPFLYSSTGMTLLLFMYWYCFIGVDKSRQSAKLPLAKAKRSII